MLTRTLMAAAALALAGCATTDKMVPVSKEFFRNDQGKVVGHREVLRNARTGEQVHEIELYAALLDAEGKVIGYEERIRGGTVVRDEEGNPIGARFIDLRSRGTNQRTEGVLFMY
jgi:hypothetical protein